MTKKTLFTFHFLFIVSLASAQSILETENLFSPNLGIEKTYQVYLPDGYYDNVESYPVVYFFRLNYWEWFNTDARPDNTALQDIADELFNTGQIGKMILVGVDLGGAPLGKEIDWGMVNMLRPELVNSEGIGTGAFEDYFFQDIIPHIDSTYRTIPDRCSRAADGFSLGGYTSLLYAMKHPEIFSSVGSYDGTLMYYDLDDTTIPGPLDDFWYTLTSGLYSLQIDAMFDNPRNIYYMNLNNPTQILVNADSTTLDMIREIAFHISAGPNNNCCNHTNNIQLLDSMSIRNIDNTFGNGILSPDATHDWEWADIHASQTLIKHWETFESLNCIPLTILEQAAQGPLSLKCFPNPANRITNISFDLAKESVVSIHIYDCLGEHVMTITNRSFPQGKHQVQVDISNYISGTYFCQLKSENHVETIKFEINK